jgi:hypothetical protein
VHAGRMHGEPQNFIKVIERTVVLGRLFFYGKERR